MPGLQAPHSFVRMVGGDLVSSRITNTDTMRIEVLRRISRPKMEWHFRRSRSSGFGRARRISEA
jgi:AraC family transcriptional regulator